MHVLFFNRSLYPDTSATGQLLTELCEDLVRHHGFQVTVVAGVSLLPSAAGPSAVRRGWLVDRETYAGITILRAHGTRFPKQRFLGRVCNYVTYFLAACVAGWRVPRPDVVIALTDPPIIGLAAWMTARRCHASFVMSYRDIFPEVGRLLNEVRSEPVFWMLEQVNRFLVRRADRVIALGATMRQRLLEKAADPAKTLVIPDWADCAAIVPGPPENAFRTAHGLTGRFVVMHSGNLGYSQNLETVIEAAQRLQATPAIQFVFVGDGATRPVLEAQARALGLTNVRFLPFQPKAGLAESFAGADLFLISLKPGLAGYIVPSKLYGILAAGRPYVAAVEEACEVTAITRQFQCGLLAEPGNPDDLARQILTLFHDPARARELGANARRAAAAFDRPVGVRAYAALCREVTRGR